MELDPVKIVENVGIAGNTGTKIRISSENKTEKIAFNALGSNTESSGTTTSFTTDKPLTDNTDHLSPLMDDTPYQEYLRAFKEIYEKKPD